MVLKKLFLGIVSFLSEINDAFCKSHPLLAQKVVTRSARAAVRLGQRHWFLHLNTYPNQSTWSHVVLVPCCSLPEFPCM